MTFVDAAIAVLSDTKKPMGVEELTELVVTRQLLSKPGGNPLRSMKGRLTAELNKGAESRLICVEPGVWSLKGASPTKGKSPAKKAAAAKTPAKKAPAKKAAAKKAPAKKAPAKKAAPKKAAAEAPAKKAAPKKAPTKKVSTKSKTTAKVAEAPVEEAAPLTEEERALAEVYGEEVLATSSVADITEYSDEHTADEDRVMGPEIVADRRGRPGRRGRPTRRKRRDRSRDGEREQGRDGERDRSRGGERDRSRDSRGARRETSREARVESRPREVAPLSVDDTSAGSIDLTGTPLALVEQAAEVLRAVNGSHSVPLRQLAQMMRKRRFISESPEAAVPRLRSALRFGERWSHRRGIRPTVVHQGRDRYGIYQSKLVDDGLAQAEARVRLALHQLEAATSARLAALVASLELPALERLVQLYLEQSGYDDVQWIKRAGRSGYAQASGPNGDVLIGARLGGEAVDRRGVGELRVGVEARGAASGLLLSSSVLSEDAQSEWEKGGKPVSLLCGPAFIEALVASGIGVRWLNAPIPYLDDGLLEALEP